MEEYLVGPKHQGYLNVIIHGKIIGINKIGGICGDLYKFASMTKCYNKGIITNAGVETARKTYIGGIVGYSSLYNSEDYKIEDCYNVGRIMVRNNSNEEDNKIGNISGEHEAGIIKNCYYIKNGKDAIGKNDDEGKVTDIIEVEIGDTDGNGKVDFWDMVAINQHRLGIKKLEGIYCDTGDVTGDGITDFWDMIQINKYRLGLISSL